MAKKWDGSRATVSGTSLIAHGNQGHPLTFCLEPQSKYSKAKTTITGSPKGVSSPFPADTRANTHIEATHRRMS